MRRVLVGVAVGAVVAFTAATGVSAYWHAQQTAPGGVATSGDLAISADWVGGTPSWSAFYPGQSTSDATIRVNADSSGDNLVWKVRLSETVTPDFEPHTTFRAWIGTCGTGTLIPAEGYGTFSSNTSRVDICVRFTLSPTAPSTLQGQLLTPQITVIAEQVSP